MKKLEQLICIFCVFWLACSSAIVVGQTEKEHETQAEKIAAGENFSRDKLVVWCIVPFDAKNRGPAERAIMVKELGLTRVAYDWRQKHKKEFEQEIIEYKKNGLEYFAFWKWDSSMAPLIKKHGITPQVWQNFRGQPPSDATQQQKIDAVIEQMAPAAKEVKELGLKFGLYNHGGWAGEPRNLIAVCEEMRSKHGLDNVGIVYNFHHAHEHIEKFKENFEVLKPYLMCVNLNGMAEPPTVKGKVNKILPIGTGVHEKAMLKTVIDSGYDGPIGVLGHRAEMDAKAAVQLNLNGLESMVWVDGSSQKNFWGNWAMVMPDGSAGWLTLSKVDGKPAGELWTVGSPKALTEISLEENTLRFKRRLAVGEPKYDGGPATGEKNPIPHHATFSGDQIELVMHKPTDEGSIEKVTYKGKRMPPLPPRPDLNQIKFGEPIELFNGKNLDGWRLTNPKQVNGWKAADGELVNTTPKMDFAPFSKYGNLQTNREFTDFNLKIEFKVPPGGNSGIYLRGMYEAQVLDRDSKMQGIHGVGSIFNRIKPTENAGKAGGEWNTYDITLVQRHATVILNGKKVIDNQPIEGCTNGALHADETKPGPLYLQGDHTAVSYRNIVLRPVIDSK